MGRSWRVGEMVSPPKVSLDQQVSAEGDLDAKFVDYSPAEYRNVGLTYSLSLIHI